jgi:integrase
LHKPYNNVGQILNEIKRFNPNLHLCCLMTYGCLLRPHREIRELTWSDFSDDLKYIHLSGDRNKFGRNRIVPVPTYIRELLVRGERHHNIFSNRPTPLNQDYFKTLWSRFKRQSNTLEQGQTLYSFRHSGAIEIFKRTGSITKLQKAMGHSSINVSLTYLRGLEITELKRRIRLWFSYFFLNCLLSSIETLIIMMVIIQCYLKKHLLRFQSLTLFQCKILSFFSLKFFF